MKKILPLLFILLALPLLADTPPPNSILNLRGGSANGVISASGGTVSSIAPGTSGNVLKSNGSAWVSGAASGAVDSVNGQTGVVVLDTDDISEGTAKYYSLSLFNASLATKTTDNLAEGTTNKYWSLSLFNAALATKTTDNLTEGSTNKYYSDTLSRLAVSATAPLSYNNSTGVFSCPTASASQSGCLSSADFSSFASGSGTVTNVSVTTANGVSGSVANATTTPAISLSLGNITPTSVAASGNISGATITGADLVGSSTIVGATITATGNFVGSLTGTASGNPPNARTISTTAPLTGGGDFSANRTFAINQSTTSTDGYLSSVDWNTFNNKQATLTHTLPLLNTANTITINDFTGDTGTGGLKGAVPAPTVNQGVTQKFLGANGVFGHPGTRYTPSEATTAVTTWTARTASAANQWFGMVWAPELHIFCGIASSGTNRVQWSRDGVTWTAASAASAVVWTKLAWSPELRLFAAVAFDGTTSTNLMTSPDCRTWTNRTSTEANQWYDIVWAPSLGKFLAVSINGTTSRCMQSTNGTTWTTCTMAAAIQWYAVTWSDDLKLFAAVSITASGSNYAATSPDGNTWTMRALTAGNTWYSVAWGKEAGRFCTVGSTGTNRAAYSPDGTTWTQSAIAAQAWRRVKWSSEQRLFVAVSSGGAISTSPDCNTWTARTAAEAIQFYDLAWSPELGIWAASGITGTSRVQTSRYLYTIAPSKIESTVAATAEKVVRRDQNGAIGAIKLFLNNAVTATNAALVYLDGHIKSMQTTAPVATVNANAGTSATCTVAAGSTDDAGTVTLVTGSGAWASGAQCSIAFNMTRALSPKCTWGRGNNNAAIASANMFHTKSTTNLVINFVNADVAGTTYEWDWICIE